MKKNLLFLIFALLFLNTIFASEPAIWTINTRDEVLKGESRGVSIDENGRDLACAESVGNFQLGTILHLVERGRRFGKYFSRNGFGRENFQS